MASDRYCLLPADLRSLPSLEAALAAAAFDFRAPTFVLAECVLVYMEPGESSALVRWLAARLPTAALAVYEQIRPEDAFGRQMLLNLAARGCPLRGIAGTPSLAAHAARLRDCGWQRAEARSMDDIYRCGRRGAAEPAVVGAAGQCGAQLGAGQCGAQLGARTHAAPCKLFGNDADGRTGCCCCRRSGIDPADRRRIERLEIFDEFEEWDLIQVWAICPLIP